MTVLQATTFALVASALVFALEFWALLSVTHWGQALLSAKGLLDSIGMVGSLLLDAGAVIFLAALRSEMLQPKSATSP